MTPLKLPGTPKNILIVDDTEDVRFLLRATISKMIPFVQITEVESGIMASVKLAQGSFDLVISDVQMENGTGLWLHYFMREHHTKTPLLLFTACPEEVSSLAKEPLRAVVPKDDLHKLINELKTVGAPRGIN